MEADSVDEVEHVLVVGCGSIGSRHARNASDLDVDVAVYDVNEARQRRLGDEIGADTPDSLEAALSSRPDVTVVATPSDKHVEPALAAARAGSHLLVEKPLSNSLDGIEQLLAVVDEKELTTMVGSNMRFHPGVEAVHELVESDAVGNIVAARIQTGSYLPDWHPDEDYRRLYAAKAGVGGVVLDAVHELNYARWLFGEVSEVSAMLGRNSSLEIETEDTAAIIAKFRTDVLCQFHFDYVQRPYARSCRLIGEEGTIVWDWDEPCVRVYDPTTDAWTEAASWSPTWETNQMYVDELSHFFACVREGRETRSDIVDGLRDLEIALAAKESSRSGEHTRL